MRRSFNKAQRNYVIIGLCMILVIMGVGYAAFQSQLKISGTSNISSNFLVRITDIQSTVLNGQASDAITPTYTDTTATFHTNLVSPGDAMRYDITVANEGNIDAVLDSIEVNTGSNDAITFETSGIKEGDALLKSTTDVLTVIVRYNSSVTSQPENTESTITVTLNYGQSDGTALPGVDGPTIGGQEVEIVDSGDGLYEDEYTEGRYVYRGSNPNNYITFNNETWRIISKEVDGTYKIMRDSILPDEMPFDNDNYRDKESNGAGGTYCANSSYGCNAWAATANMVGSPSQFVNGSYSGTVLLDSSLNTYLNGTYYNSLNNTARTQIQNHVWNIGGIFDEDTNNDGKIELALEEEKKYQWQGNVGLINETDYLNANSNQSLCSSGMSFDNNLETCVATDWMYIPGTYWWSLSPDADNTYGVFFVYDGGIVSSNSARGSNGVRPVVYLISSISLSGEGTQSNPYTIN